MADATAEPKKGDTKIPLAKELYTKGGEFFEENKFDEAIDLYGQAIKVDPSYSSAYFNRALSYAILNKYTEAVRDAETVMRIEPDSADAPYVMGIICEYQSDFKGSKEWYEKSLAKNPNYEQARARLDQLKKRMENPVNVPGLGGTGTGAGAQAIGTTAVGATTVIKEGQLQQKKWFSSNMTMQDVVGMKDAKKLIYENIILAMRKPELLKAYGKKLGLGVLFYGPPGCGKCVHEDTEVLLPDGRCMKIKEVVDRKEPYILTLTKQHKLSVSKVSGWWKLEGKPLLKITTKRGRVIKCTPEHPLLTRAGWKEASTFEEGALIGVPRETSVFGNTVMRECEVKLLAYFITEGTLTQGSPRFTNVEPELLEDFRSAVAQFDSALHINTHVDSGDVRTLQVAGRYVNTTGPRVRSSMQTFLDAHGLSFTSSYDKKVPAAVFTLQKHLLALFLNRMFSGDGWFEDREEPGTKFGAKRHRIIGYSSNSETLVRQVQHLLLRFGVLSSIHGPKDNGNWQLRVMRSRDIDRFIDEVGMFGERAEILVKKKDSWSKIKKKGGNRVVYEGIKSIERLSAPEYVYDLTVEETHNFIAGDFFVHNTYIIKAVAGETKSNVLIAAINEIVDMYAGNTEKNLHAIFEQARKNTPAILFFDEIDAMGGKREGGGESMNYMRMAVNQFLTEMDGVEKNPEGIFVVGATNQPWDMDPALKRSGRFGEQIYIPAPDYSTRKQAFIYNTKKMPLARGVNFGRLSRATMGFSQADIAEICDKAALIPAVEEDMGGKRRPVKMRDFLRMIKQHGGTLDEWYAMVKKDIISKTETQIVEGKKQEIVKEGKLSPEEKQRYKPLVKSVKRNVNPFWKFTKKFVRAFSLYVF